MAEQVVLQPGPVALTAHRRSLRALTGIRFFAAYYVVFYHTRIFSTLLEHGYTAPGNFFRNGYLAVPLFFLLSGFILAYTYEGNITGPGKHRRFWEARFARIWPVYAISLVCCSLPALDFPRPSVMLAALLMVQAWLPNRIDLASAWNFVCWTLSVEAFFYLTFPWLQAALERWGRRAQLGLIGLMLVVACAFNLSASGIGQTGSTAVQWLPLPLAHLPEFFIGVAMGNLYLRQMAVQAIHPGRPMLPGAGLWTYTSALLTIGLLCRPTNQWTSLVLLGFAPLLYGLAAERTLLSRLLSTRPLLLGGSISYSVYLMQAAVKSWTSLLFQHIHASDGVRMVATAVLLLLIAFTLYTVVEDPARKLLRSLFARLEVRNDRALQREEVTL